VAKSPLLPALRARLVTGLALSVRSVDWMLGRQPQPVIWVLGHMRAGTSLLCHLLLTHPQIASIGERNRTYTTALDFDRLLVAVRLARREFWHSYRYVVDQINHSHFTPVATLLNHPRVRVIFLVREPVATIASILEVARTYYQAWSAERAADYYTERLDTLAVYGQAIQAPSQARFLNYSDLVQQTETTLHHLQTFLGLETGFTSTYQLHPFTGKHGDPSTTIRTGHIVRPSRSPSLTIDSDRLTQAQAHYDRCVTTLNRFR